MKGTTAVEIVRDDDLTELDYLTPDAKWGALVGAGAKESFGPGTSLADIARAVLAIFERMQRSADTAEVGVP
jgi:hypothetical protein